MPVYLAASATSTTYDVGFASLGQASMVVGANWFGVSAGMESPVEASLLPVSGGSIPGPKRLSHVIHPRAVFDDDDRLHLIWAETDVSNGATTPFPLVAPTSLWASHYDSLSGWSPAQKLISDDLFLAKESVDRIIRDGVNLSFDVLGKQGLYRATLGRNGWVVAQREVPLSAVSVSLASKPGVLTAAFLSATPDSSDRNSVYFSIDSDSAPRLLSRSGMLPASNLRLRFDDRGRLHLVWIQQTAVARELRHLISLNDGVSWSAVSARSIPSDARGLEAVVDRCDRLVVAFRASSSPGRTSLFSSTWHKSWSDVRELPITVSVIDHALDTDTSGTVVAALLVRVEGEAQRPLRTALVSLTR